MRKLFILFTLLCFSCVQHNVQEYKKVSSINSSLTTEEKKVSKRWVEIRKSFAENLDMPLSTFYSLPFHEAQKIIDTTALYGLTDNMPKGGLLHIHSGGITSAEWIIEKVKKDKNCFVFDAADNTDYIYGQLSFFRKNEIPQGFVNLGEKLASQPDFEKTLYKLLVLKEDPKREKNVWIEFEKRFKRISSLLSYRPFFKEYYRAGFKHLIENKIQHLEIRFIFENLYDFDVKKYPIETIVLDLKSIIDAINKEEQKLTLTLIYTSFKFLSVEAVREQYLQAVKLKKKYPDFIRGFDLVADEKTGNSIVYYNEIWNTVEKIQQEHGVNLPFYFHAGESLSVNNRNIEQTLLLPNKRIGHGLNLIYFPDDLQKVKKENVLIEINPWSNKILEYVKDLRNHPARIFLANDLICSISSDDPGVFGYSGLTYDFWIAIMAWELDLGQVKKLVFDSIEYASLTERQKTESLQKLETDWNSFIQSQNTQIDNSNETKIYNRY